MSEEFNLSLPDYFIKNRSVSFIFTLLLLIGGILSFNNLSRLELPEFPIPRALVNTAYPGASPLQVEEEVTLPLEKAIQELEYVKFVDSFSSAGMSQIQIELWETYTGAEQPQIWDELRRKVSDIQSQLPNGAMASQVIDDFSDVYGILYNISANDYSYRELENYADFLKRELSLVPGVRRVNIAGQVQEQIVIEISQSKLRTLGLDPSTLSQLIRQYNLPSNAGSAFIGGDSLRIHTSGEFNTIDDLESLLIKPSGQAAMIRLGDIARVYKKFDDRPQNLYRNNDEKALSLAISFSKGVNVVDVGHAVDTRLAELESSRPIGMSLTGVYDQPKLVDKSVSDFLFSLLQAIVIVIAILLLSMGMRSGILMGGILLLTILGTFIGMSMLDIEIQIISLGALIIALGMLVDNAIVITEGILVGLKQGMKKRDAIKLVTKQTTWPLLGATAIAIITFAPIGLSQNSTGDFMQSLFYVLLISLSLSWLIAITLTPFFAQLTFKEKTSEGNEQSTYDGRFFQVYKALLGLALRNRLLTLLLVFMLLIAAMAGFANVKQAFFPPSNTPLFMVDLWLQQGSDIRQTEATVSDISEKLERIDGVNNVTSVIGMGAQRFSLTYNPEFINSSFAQLLINTDSLAKAQEIIPIIRQKIEEDAPHIELKFRTMELGPAPRSRIEARFYGPEPEVLRQLGSQAIAIIDQHSAATATRHNWRESTTIIQPQINEAAMRRSGLSKQDIDAVLRYNFNGEVISILRERSHQLPILLQSPEEERFNINRVEELQIWSREFQQYVAVSQVLDDFRSSSEDSMIVRRNQKRALSVFTDVAPFSNDTAESLRLKIAPEIEAIKLPEGYSFEWGGEYQDQRMAEKSLFASVPMGYLIMFLITVLLFKKFRQALAVWLTVPLSIIGVSAGLLLLNIPFTFTALLGLLSLSGMLAKNGIVLIEQINIEESEGNSPQYAIFNAAVSRARPVCMAAATTLLGMIPLIFDAFFASMAVTIIFGLGFATLLTLIVLPVIYSALYRVRFSK